MHYEPLIKLFCLVVILMLPGCLPVGIRGTSMIQQNVVEYETAPLKTFMPFRVSPLHDPAANSFLSSDDAHSAP